MSNFIGPLVRESTPSIIADKLRQADVVLIGVSRTSKTPTCIYLAHRGIKAANIPLVPGNELPAALDEINIPLIVGLIASPERPSIRGRAGAKTFRPSTISTSGRRRKGESAGLTPPSTT